MAFFGGCSCPPSRIILACLCLSPTDLFAAQLRTASMDPATCWNFFRKSATFRCRTCSMDISALATMAHSRSMSARTSGSQREASQLERPTSGEHDWFNDSSLVDSKHVQTTCFASAKFIQGVWVYHPILAILSYKTSIKNIMKPAQKSSRFHLPPFTSAIPLGVGTRNLPGARALWGGRPGRCGRMGCPWPSCSCT